MRHPTLNSDHYDLNREEYGSRRWTMGPWKGIVTEHRDNSGTGRVKIRIPQLHGMNTDIIDDYSLPWAYPITLDPGATSGSFDIPDKGAKVWVFFEQGDINHPLWFGGWITQNSGPAPPPNPAAAPVKAAAKKVTEAAKSIDAASKEAGAAGQSTVKAADSVANSATVVQGAATKAAQAVSALAENPLAPSSSSLSTAQGALATATAAKASASSSLDRAATTNDAAQTAASNVAKSTSEAIASLGEAESSVSSTVEGSSSGVEDPSFKSAVDAGKSIMSSITEITANAMQLSSFASALTDASKAVHTSAQVVFNHAASVESTVKAAIDAVLGGYTTVDQLTQTMLDLSNLSESISNRVQDSILDLNESVMAKVESTFATAKQLSTASASMASLSKASEAILVENVTKIMGKKLPDPSVVPTRPENYADQPWVHGPGSEIPDEAQGMSNNVPSVRVWKKSNKGHTLMCEDQDGKESMTFLDRAGNAMYFNCPVDPKYNSGNMMFRKQRSTMMNDAVDRIFMRDKGSQVGIQDQAQSKIELDSRMGAAKVTIVANDGTGGIENGENRQKAEFMADAKCIIVESVKDGEVLAKIFIDANSGVVVVEAARFVNLHAPYVSVDADHINLNGRVNVAGDMTISGRLTGGNK